MERVSCQPCWAARLGPPEPRQGAIACGSASYVILTCRKLSNAELSRTEHGHDWPYNDAMDELLQPLPLFTADLPGIGGRIKAQPEDFEVEEIPAYEPSRRGRLPLPLGREARHGRRVLRAPGRQRLGIPPGEVGTAGLKDRHAVTRQWVSVPAAGEARLAAARRRRHPRAAGRAGTPTSSSPATCTATASASSSATREPTRAERLPPLLDAICAAGAAELLRPAALRPRRRDGRSSAWPCCAASRGRRDGQPVPAQAGPVGGAVGAVQPLPRRGASTDGLLHRVLPGDVMAKWPFGGMFVAEDVAARAGALRRARDRARPARCSAARCSRRRPRPPSARRRCCATPGCAGESFAGFGKLLQGTRRHNLVYLDDLAATLRSRGRAADVHAAGGQLRDGAAARGDEDQLCGRESREPIVAPPASRFRPFFP